MKILITEFIWENGIQELENIGYEVDYDQNLSRKKEELLRLLPDYDAVIVRNETKVNEEFLAQAKKTKVIGRLGVGLDNIDLKAARAKNIPVVSARNANATSVAEYVMASILDSARPIQAADQDVKQGNWNKKKFTGTELHGKTVGLIGMGEIAHRVAKRAKAFEMNIVGYDPFIGPFDHMVQEVGAKQVDTLEALLKEVDFVSVHVPLLESTYNLLNKDMFKIMKKEAVIINSARGGIINESDLVEAVEAKEIAGAYLDVIEKEPIQPDSPISKMKDIHLTPHIAGLTKESQYRTALLIATEVNKIINGQDSICRVN